MFKVSIIAKIMNGTKINGLELNVKIDFRTRLKDTIEILREIDSR